MAKLGVNIDHVATLRQARRGVEPDPVWAAVQAQLAGADGITLHVREDRRHIQERDARLIRQIVQVKYNLEMAASDELLRLVDELQPDQVTLVPERREEVTTEGGLDVRGQLPRTAALTKEIKQRGVLVSLFIDPALDQVQASLECQANAIELHTGRYADAESEMDRQTALAALQEASAAARRAGLTLHLGHGLNYHNVQPIAAIPDVDELNIGHAIVSRAIFVGFGEAVREMKRLIAS